MTPYRFEKIQVDRSNPVLIESVLLLAIEVTSKHDTDQPVSEKEINSSINRAQERGYSYYGVRDSSADLIAAACVQHGAWNPPMTEIWQMAVAEQARGKGIGKALLKHIAQQAVVAGDEYLQLMSLEDGFYKHHGFTDAVPGNEGVLVASAAAVLDS